MHKFMTNETNMSLRYSNRQKVYRIKLLVINLRKKTLDYANTAVTLRNRKLLALVELRIIGGKSGLNARFSGLNA